MLRRIRITDAGFPRNAGSDHIKGVKMSSASRTAVCRLCRRENEKLFLKGSRCTSSKCALERRAYIPGEQGVGSRRRRPSNYAMQLREKQKARRIYGIRERQFRNYFKKAERAKMATGSALIQFLERRIDNIIYRANLASSRSRARQMVNHGFLRVNGRKVDIPSFLVNAGDKLTLDCSDQQKKDIKKTAEIMDDRVRPDWFEVDMDSFTIDIKRLPTKDDIGIGIEENLIVELYSK